MQSADFLFSTLLDESASSTTEAFGDVEPLVVGTSGCLMNELDMLIVSDELRCLGFESLQIMQDCNMQR